MLSFICTYYKCVVSWQLLNLIVHIMRVMYWFLSQLINTDDAAVAKTKLVLTLLSGNSKMSEQMNYGGHDFPIRIYYCCQYLCFCWHLCVLLDLILLMIHNLLYSRVKLVCHLQFHCFSVSQYPTLLALCSYQVVVPCFSGPGIFSASLVLL